MKHTITTFICFLSLTLYYASNVRSSTPTVEHNPVYSPDSSKIAFSSNGNKTTHIWVMNANKTNKHELSHLNNDVAPAWSPDGHAIAFQSYGNNNTAENKFSIWVMNDDGSNPHQLIEPAKEGDQYPCWSPNGKYIVWTHGKQLWIMDNNGQNAHPLTTQAAKTFEYCGHWSPDGHQIAYLADNMEKTKSIGTKIWLIDSNGSNQKLFNAGIAAYAVTWSKDGKFLYYNSCPSIMKISTQPNSLPQKILELGSECSKFDISPNEKQIAYDDITDSGKIIIKPLALPPANKN